MILPKAGVLFGARTVIDGNTTPTPGVYDVNGETFQAVKAAVNDPYMNP